jgi:hypothetical protein
MSREKLEIQPMVENISATRLCLAFFWHFSNTKLGPLQSVPGRQKEDSAEPSTSVTDNTRHRDCNLERETRDWITWKNKNCRIQKG